MLQDPLGGHDPGAVLRGREARLLADEDLGIDDDGDVAAQPHRCGRLGHGSGERGDERVGTALVPRAVVVRTGRHRGLAESFVDGDGQMGGQGGVDPGHGVLDVHDLHRPSPPGPLGPSLREVGLDPDHEPAQPRPQLGDGVRGGVAHDALIEPFARLRALQQVQGGGDLPHPRRVDATRPESQPRRRRMSSDPPGAGETVLHLPLGQPDCLTDLQRDRGPLDEPHHRRHVRAVDPRELGIGEGQHGRPLGELRPRPHPRDLAQHVNRRVGTRGGRGLDGHESNVHSTTDTVMQPSTRADLSSRRPTIGRVSRPTRALAARTTTELVTAWAEGERPKVVAFWSHVGRGAEIGPHVLSQWFPSRFTDEYGRAFQTAEHYMMWRKAALFDDSTTAEKILAARSPGAAKALGRHVEGFDESVWADERWLIVVEGSVLKFQADAHLRDYLLATRNRVLVEASPKDTVWGVGLPADFDGIEVPTRWQGLNLLGFALMEARARLSSR